MVTDMVRRHTFPSAARYLLAGIVVGTLFATIAVGGDLDDPENRRNLVGGKRTSSDGYPFIAKISPNRGGICQGVVIHPRWVLTAAHCMVKDDGSLQEIWAIQIRGDKLFSGAMEQRVPLRVILHPEWRKEGAVYRNDLALIELTEPFGTAEPDRVILATEAVERQYAQSGTSATAVSYPDAGDLVLEKIEIPLFQADTCAGQIQSRAAQLLAQGLIVTERIVCTATVGVGAERGDSGGPLLVPLGNEGHWLSVGVLSQSLTNASGQPIANFYTRVSQYVDWIQTVTSVKPGLVVSANPAATTVIERLDALIQLHADQSREFQQEMQKLRNVLKSSEQ